MKKPAKGGFFHGTPGGTISLAAVTVPDRYRVRTRYRPIHSFSPHPFQLFESTDKMNNIRQKTHVIHGTPGRTRTCNLVVRTHLLNPIELPGLIASPNIRAVCMFSFCGSWNNEYRTLRFHLGRMPKHSDLRAFLKYL